MTDRCPLDPEAAGELGAELGLVEVAGGAGMQEDVSGVEGAPPVVAAGGVRDKDVGVEVRVAGSAGAMAKRRGDEPVAANLVDAVGSPARPTGLVSRGSRSRRAPRRSCASRTALGGVPVAESPQHRHRLRRTEREIETRDPAMPAPAKPFPAERVTARQDLVKVLAGDATLEAEHAGEATGPTAGGFSVTEVVVLRTLCHRV